jgi:hypothetical protein
MGGFHGRLYTSFMPMPKEIHAYSSIRPLPFFTGFRD